MADQSELSGDFRGATLYIKSSLYNQATPLPVRAGTLVAAQERVAALLLDDIPSIAPCHPAHVCP